MIRTQIQLTEEQARTLKTLAAARDASVAELIRQGVDSLLAEAGSVDREERKRRAIAAAGRFHSGRRNVSSEHDDYLAKAYRP